MPDTLLSWLCLDIPLTAALPGEGQSCVALPTCFWTKLFRKLKGKVCHLCPSESRCRKGVASAVYLLRNSTWEAMGWELDDSQPFWQREPDGADCKTEAEWTKQRALEPRSPLVLALVWQEKCDLSSNSEAEPKKLQQGSTGEAEFS